MEVVGNCVGFCFGVIYDIAINLKRINWVELFFVAKYGDGFLYLCEGDSPVYSCDKLTE